MNQKIDCLYCEQPTKMMRIEKEPEVTALVNPVSYDCIECGTRQIFHDKKQKTVCFVATYYKKDYIRQSMILKALEQTKFNVIKCVENSKSILRYPKVLLKFLKQRNKCDIVLVGFRGQEILPIIYLLTKKKIVFDAFISFYDRLCFDRKKFSPNSLIGKLVLMLDRINCLLAEKVLLDTNEHITHFSKLTSMPETTFSKVYIGADQDKFFPVKSKTKKDKTIVLWYGSFVPLQGFEYVLEAASILKDNKEIEFWFAGNTQSHEKELPNSKFFDFVPHNKMPSLIAQADICIGGQFKGNQSAKTIIAGKVFEMIAMKKPVIVGESNAVKELFVNWKDVLMVEMQNAKEISKAILKLKENKLLALVLASNSYKVFLKNCTTKALAKNLEGILSEY